MEKLQVSSSDFHSSIHRICQLELSHLKFLVSGFLVLDKVISTQKAYRLTSSSSVRYLEDESESKFKTNASFSSPFLLLLQLSSLFSDFLNYRQKILSTFSLSYTAYERLMNSPKAFLLPFSFRLRRVFSSWVIKCRLKML